MIQMEWVAAALKHIKNMAVTTPRERHSSVAERALGFEKTELPKSAAPAIR
jgi:hypothetical protein